MIKKKIPIGIENFESLRTSDFYYIDKAKFITELLQDESSPGHHYRSDVY